MPGRSKTSPEEKAKKLKDWNDKQEIRWNNAKLNCIAASGLRSKGTDMQDKTDHACVRAQIVNSEVIHELRRIGIETDVDIRGSDKVRALELLGKHLKLFGDEKSNDLRIVININKTYGKSVNTESAKVIDVIAVKPTNNEKP